MPTLSPDELVRQLRDATFQVRTGVLLVPVRSLSRGPDIAAQFGVDWVDLVRWKLERLVPGSRYLGPDAGDSLLRDLTELASEAHVTSCLLVGNADVLLARLSYADRERAWSFLYQDFRKRAVGIIFFLAEEATGLFSLKQRERWEGAGRLAALSLERERSA